MDQINQPGADTNDINARPVSESAPPAPPAEVPDVPARQPNRRSPVTFREAEAHNPSAPLTALHDHAVALRLHEKPPTLHLTELPLSAPAVG